MKYLFLVRHAKSSWDQHGIPDKERPLNDRGQRDAPAMARRLLQKNIRPQFLVTSTARRAKQTCKHFAEVLGIQASHIMKTDMLYMAGSPEFREVIAQLPEAYDSVVLFAHNPGITVFANELTNARVDDMPTCAVFALKAHCLKWKDFEDAEKDFWFFDWPKNPAALSQ